MTNVITGGAAARQTIVSPYTPTIVVLMMTCLVLMLWAPSVTSVGDLNLSFLLAGGLALFALPARGQGLQVAHFDLGAFAVLLVSGTLLAGFAMASFLWADQPFRVFRVVYGQAFGLIVLLLFARFRDGSLVEVTRNALVLGALCSAVLAILGSMIPAIGALLTGGGDRTAALFKQSNQLGIALSMTFPIVIGYISTRRGRLLPGVAACIVMYLGLAMSGSKTNLIIATVTGLSMVVCVLAIRKVFTRQPHVAVVILALALAGCVGGYFALEIINPRAHRLLVTFAVEGEAPSLMARDYVHASALDDGFAAPLTGVGAGQLALNGRYTHSHNVFLDSFRTLGVPGLAFVFCQLTAAVLLALSALAQVVRPPTQAAADRIVLTGFAFSVLSYIASNQMSDSFGPSTSPLFWLCLAGLVAVRARSTAAYQGQGR